MEKFLTAQIYRSDYNSVLNKFNGLKSVVYPTNEGLTYLQPNDETPAIIFITRNINGRLYTHAEPANKAQGEHFAMGGSFLYDSDSRFPYDYPVALHDRRMNLER